MKQFCKHSHDILIVGRDINGTCLECKKIRSKSFYKVNSTRLNEASKVKYHKDPEKFINYQRSRSAESHKLAILKHRCKKVGITLEHYNSLSKRCSFKSCSAVKPGGIGDWHLDHDHATRKFRGLLCHRHNLALGLFHDSIGELQNAINYLLEN